MYVARAVACTAPNGELPLSPAAIAGPQNRRATLESKIRTAQAGFNRAVDRVQADFRGMSRTGLYAGSANWETWPGNLRVAPWPWGAGGNTCLARSPLMPAGFETLRPIQTNPLESPAEVERAAAVAGCAPGRNICDCLDDGSILPASVPSALIYECGAGRGGVAIAAPAAEVAQAIAETGSGDGLAGGVGDYLGTAAAIFAGGLALLLFGPRIDGYLRKRGFLNG